MALDSYENYRKQAVYTNCLFFYVQKIYFFTKALAFIEKIC